MRAGSRRSRSWSSGSRARVSIAVASRLAVVSEPADTRTRSMSLASPRSTVPAPMPSANTPRRPDRSVGGAATASSTRASMYANRSMTASTGGPISAFLVTPSSRAPSTETVETSHGASCGGSPISSQTVRAGTRSPNVATKSTSPASMTASRCSVTMRVIAGSRPATVAGLRWDCSSLRCRAWRGWSAVESTWTGSPKRAMANVAGHPVPSSWRMLTRLEEKSAGRRTASRMSTGSETRKVSWPGICHTGALERSTS